MQATTGMGMPSDSLYNCSSDRLASEVKQHDNDRYLCALFAPEKKRAGLFALYAFNQEVARIRENITEPMMGLIRLAWWREAIEELYTGTVRNHDVLTELHEAMQHRLLPQALFEQMIDGRERDMEEESPADMEALELYGEATSSSLFQLAFETVGIDSDEAQKLAYHLGIAWMLVGYMRAIRFYAASKRVLLPQEYLEKEGISAADIISGRHLEKTKPIVKILTERAKYHLREVKKLQHTVPSIALPVLLPAVIAAIFIRRIEKVNYALFQHDLEQNRVVIQLAVLWKAWRKKV